MVRDEHRHSEEHEQSHEQALLRTQAELAHLSRVLTMGELMTSIAHEMNQPLTAVVAHGYACLGWLAAAPPNMEKAHESAERIIEDGTRAAAVLGRIRALFRKEEVTRTTVDLNDVIRELALFLQDEATRRNVSIRVTLAADLPSVIGDRVQLQQVVLNLVVNAMEALDARAGVKEVRIASSHDRAGEILVCIDDTGTGVGAEVERRMFDPFFTTKPQGLGMGLSISRSIVESHAGRLWATRSPSGGARLAAIRASDGTRDQGPTIVIYVVDDDASVRTALQNLFASMGRAATAFESTEAFLRAKRPDVPSCLVLDIRLPGVGGLEFQQDLARRGVHIPIVFITAHGDIPMTARAMKAGAIAFLTKPLQRDELLAAVHEAIEHDRVARAAAQGLAGLRARFAALSGREREVMAFVTAGLGNRGDYPGQTRARGNHNQGPPSSGHVDPQCRADSPLRIRFWCRSLAAQLEERTERSRPTEETDGF